MLFKILTESVDIWPQQGLSELLLCFRTRWRSRIKGARGKLYLFRSEDTLILQKFCHLVLGYFWYGAPSSQISTDSGHVKLKAFVVNGRDCALPHIAHIVHSMLLMY